MNLDNNVYYIYSNNSLNFKMIWIMNILIENQNGIQNFKLSSLISMKELKYLQ